MDQEAQWIEKAKRGDKAAFSALVRMHQEKIFHGACSFLKNREDAFDVTQEVFVKAFDALPSFKGNSRFSTWLYRILANQCKDFLRKRSVRKHLFFVLKRDEEVEDVRREEQIPSPYLDVREQLIGKETGKLIQEAVETLPFQQRSAFVLRYLEGLSLEEIAQSLDLSEGAVKAHLWQAAQKMQKRLSTLVLGRN